MSYSHDRQPAYGSDNIIINDTIVVDYDRINAICHNGYVSDLNEYIDSLICNQYNKTGGSYFIKQTALYHIVDCCLKHNRDDLIKYLVDLKLLYRTTLLEKCTLKTTKLALDGTSPSELRNLIRSRETSKLFSNNDADSIKYILDMYGEDALAHDRCVDACTAGNLELFKAAIYKTYVKEDRILDATIIRNCCEAIYKSRGEKYTTDVLDLFIDLSRSKESRKIHDGICLTCHLLAGLVKLGCSLEIFRKITDMKKIENPTYSVCTNCKRNTSVFSVCCNHGRLDLIKEFYDMSKITITRKHLSYACIGGNLELVKFIYDECKDTVTNKDARCMIDASVGRSKDVIEWLLLKRPIIHTDVLENVLSDIYGKITKEMVPKIKYLVKLILDSGLNISNAALHKAFPYACKFYDIEMMEIFILDDRYKDVLNYSDGFYASCVSRNTNNAMYLLTNFTSKINKGMIGYACAKGMYEVVEYFVKQGISDCYIDMLSCAISNNKANIVEYMLNNTNVIINQNHIETAVNFQYVECLKLLLNSIQVKNIIERKIRHEEVKMDDGKNNTTTVVYVDSDPDPNDFFHIPFSLYPSDFVMPDIILTKHGMMYLLNHVNIRYLKGLPIKTSTKSWNDIETTLKIRKIRQGKVREILLQHTRINTDLLSIVTDYIDYSYFGDMKGYA